MKRIRVVAGILYDSAGRVLIAERHSDDALAGKWEFPGGKIDAGESAVAALARELAEELDVHVLSSRHFMSLQHDYPDRRVAVSFYLVNEWSRQPQGREGQDLEWVDPLLLDADRLLAADAPVLDALKKGTGLSHKCEFHD